MYETVNSFICFTTLITVPFVHGANSKLTYLITFDTWACIVIYSFILCACCCQMV